MAEQTRTVDHPRYGEVVVDTSGRACVVVSLNWEVFLGDTREERLREGFKLDWLGLNGTRWLYVGPWEIARCDACGQPNERTCACVTCSKCGVRNARIGRWVCDMCVERSPFRCLYCECDDSSQGCAAERVAA